MHGNDLIIYTLLVLGFGGFLGILLEHLWKNVLAYKHVGIVTVGLVFTIGLIVVVAPSTLPGDVAHVYRSIRVAVNSDADDSRPSETPRKSEQSNLSSRDPSPGKTYSDKDRADIQELSSH